MGDEYLEYLNGLNTGLPLGSVAGGLGAAQRQRDDAARRQANEDSASSGQQGKGNTTSGRVDRSLKSFPTDNVRLDVIIIASIGALIYYGCDYFRPVPQIIMNKPGTVYVPPAEPVCGKSFSADGAVRNVNEEFSREVVRVCDKPAAQAMGTAVTCFAVQPRECVSLTPTAEAEGSYRIAKYDEKGQQQWQGFASKDYFEKTVKREVAPGVIRIVPRYHKELRAQIQIADAYGTLYPYVGNETPSDVPSNNERRYPVSRDAVEIKGAVEKLWCAPTNAGSLCEVGIKTPGGDLYGVMKETSLKNPRDGYYGQIAGPRAAPPPRPAVPPPRP